VDWGDDLININDELTIAGGLNNQPAATYYQDVIYGGAGRDVLIGNTGGDRLIDWMG
jgi:Ca2+-binding RTX toxin-like protein